MNTCTLYVIDNFSMFFLLCMMIHTFNSFPSADFFYLESRNDSFTDMVYHPWKVWELGQIFYWEIFLILNLWLIRIGLGNGLASIWRQGISQSNVDKSLCSMDAVCEGNELDKYVSPSHGCIFFICHICEPHYYKLCSNNTTNYVVMF